MLTAFPGLERRLRRQPHHPFRLLRRGLLRHRLPGIVLVSLPQRQDHGCLVHLGVGELLQQVIDAVEARPFLVNRVDHPPAGLGNVGAL